MSLAFPSEASTIRGLAPLRQGSLRFVARKDPEDVSWAAALEDGSKSGSSLGIKATLRCCSSLGDGFWRPVVTCSQHNLLQGVRWSGFV